MPEPKYTPHPTKRFDISTDEYSRRRLEALRESFVALKERFPSVGIALFGSLSKGKVLTQESRTISDVDVNIFIDAKEIPDYLSKQDVLQIGQEAITKRLSEKEPHSKWYMIRDVHVVAFDAKKIVDDLTNVDPRKSEESADVWYAALDSASKLFQLDVGGGLAKFRKALLEELKTLPPNDRKKIWTEIFNRIIFFERGKTDVPPELVQQYPDTFEEALRYYRS